MSEAHPEHVVITGASGGLGAAIARRYASSGATLGLIARRSSELDRLATDCPGPCATHAVDVRDSASMRAAAAEFSARHGVPDIVIANAGVSIGTLTEAPEDEQAFRDELANLREISDCMGGSLGCIALPHGDPQICLLDGRQVVGAVADHADPPPRLAGETFPVAN